MIPSAHLDFDVAIIGAGISGINSAYRVQTQTAPGTTYKVLEARNDLGGTWNFFKYPGLRSDSDLHTFGFAWKPWRHGKAIATADAIMGYLRECVNEAGIDKHIQYGTRMVSANWNSQTLCWEIQTLVNGQPQEYKARFIIIGTGYYDYEEPLQAVIPGIEKFQGKIIHPQFWPSDLDMAGKDMVVIGSGATAITLVPNVADKVKHVTMLQRSPSYVFSVGMKDPTGAFMKMILPASWAASFDRFRWTCLSYLLFYFCRTFPNAAKKMLQAATKAQLPKDGSIPWDPNFKPAYNPWEQRLCLCPDGDFYKALRGGNADIVTDKIKMVTENSIELESGNRLKPDIIVTATGLKMLMAGGAQFFIDGKALSIPSKYMWKGVMLQDLPNAAFVIGYTNASWTLGADATAFMVTRLMRYMSENKIQAAVPRVKEGDSMGDTPMLNLNSTYIQKAIAVMPKTGTGQWAPRTNYFSDMKEAKKGDILTNLQMYKEGVKTIGTGNGKTLAAPAQPMRADSAMDMNKEQPEFKL